MPKDIRAYPYSQHNQAFVAWSYITATVASVMLFALLKVRGVRLSYKLKPAVFLFAVAAGVILGVFQAFYKRAVANIDGVLLFPTFNGGALILSTLSGVLLLGDRLKPNQIVSIAVGVAAIIVMNI